MASINLFQNKLSNVIFEKQISKVKREYKIDSQSWKISKGCMVVLEEPATCSCQPPHLLSLPYTYEYKHWFCCPYKCSMSFIDKCLNELTTQNVNFLSISITILKNGIYHDTFWTLSTFNRNIKEHNWSYHWFHNTNQLIRSTSKKSSTKSICHSNNSTVIIGILIFMEKWYGKGVQCLWSRALDFQLRESGFESCVGKFFHSTLLQFTQLYKWVSGYRQWWSSVWAAFVY